jgi:hypothetical protein
MDLGSVNAPPPLEHRQSGVGWSLSLNPRIVSASSQARTGGRVGPQVTSLQAKKNVDRQQAT